MKCWIHNDDWFIRHWLFDLPMNYRWPIDDWCIDDYTDDIVVTDDSVAMKWWLTEHLLIPH